MGVAAEISPFDIPNFARSCKYLNKIAESQLKKHRDLSERFDQVCVGFTRRQNTLYLHPVSLVADIQENPDVGFHIKSLAYSVGAYTNYMDRADAELLEEYNRCQGLLGPSSGLDSLLPPRSRPGYNAEESDRADIQPDPFLLDLLLLLPNLKSLEVDLFRNILTPSEDFLVEYLKRMCDDSTAVSDSGPLRKLETMSILNYGEILVRPHPLLVSLMFLPTIKKFEGAMLDTTHCFSEIGDPRLMCPAEEVSITSSSSPRGLHILCAFSSMQKLSCRCRGSTFSPFIGTLEPYAATTLEELHLDFSFDRDTNPPRLHSLINLRLVDLHAKFFIPPIDFLDRIPITERNIRKLIDTLPPSIRRIIVRFDRNASVLGKIFKDFALLQPERLPHLEGVSLEFASEDDETEALSNIDDSIKSWLV